MTTPHYHASTHTPRFSDLDTQLHVTSRTYETFADEARFGLLKQAGYDFRRITNEKLFLYPTHSHVNFLRQQMPGATLHCQTLAFPEKESGIFWHQQFFEDNKDKKLAAEIFTRTETVGPKQQPFAILPSEGPSQTSPKEAKDKMPMPLESTGPVPSKEEIDKHRGLLIDLPAFSGSCKQIERTNTPLYTLRNFNWQYSSGELWRLCEDGRWHMFNLLGIDFDMIQKTDTTAFFMGATFRYHERPQPNQPLIQKIWIEKIQKIRMYIRQELYRPDQPKTPILSSREFVIFVSVSKSRPKRIDDRWMELISPYLEFPEK